ncbi:MAG: hypothetical protein HY291_18955 [Planctomycetes bacterium]|nr:hypothetical protein [Planctomycetota bacterium]
MRILSLLALLCALAASAFVCANDDEAPAPAEPFALFRFGARNGGGRRLMVMRHGGSKATESAVETALTWLRNHQEVNGCFDSRKYEASAETDTTVTALAVLAFLGAGHTEKVGQYKDNVARAVAWLIARQKASGEIAGSADEAKDGLGLGAPHALAAWALAEAAGMGRKPDTIEAAQKAVDFSAKAQLKDADGKLAGWAMASGKTGSTQVSAYFILSLKAAKGAGLKVPDETLNGAARFLDSVQKAPPPDKAVDPEAAAKLVADLDKDEFAEREGAQKALLALGHAAEPVLREALKHDPSTEAKMRMENILRGITRSSHFAPAADAPLDANAHRLTALGTLCRLALTNSKDDNLAACAEWVANRGAPEWGDGGKQADLIHWQAASLLLFQQDGDLWKKWNAAQKDTLAEHQLKGGDDDGSWNAVGQDMEHFGKVASTALGALCLETYYRYLKLPPQTAPGGP